MSPIEEANLKVSVSMVKETKASVDNVIAKEDQAMSGDSFESISVTGENGEVDSDSSMKSQRDNQKVNNKGTKTQRKKTRSEEDRGEESVRKKGWNVDEEVIMVLDMGTRLGIDFQGKKMRLLISFVGEKGRTTIASVGMIDDNFSEERV
ncbi:hypothetical protein QYF36_024136 [Acer negundo]|nr:hypothetical protein QYF36_024136 [Acer negundo]